ncbi:MAG TPA: DUF2804 domain-containing protein [Feifaniaceae bacterium]|nr:DUF2804 domain-containing protein [Feifaniaceae bacterium]
MQHEIMAEGPLLDRAGNLKEPGWSKRMLLQYDRKAVKKSAWRIKEWDYYIVSDGKHGAAFTVADNGYMGLLSASVLDFTRPWEHTDSIMEAFPFGKYRMPAISKSGDVEVSKNGCSVRFLNRGTERRIVCTYRQFYENRTLDADITLHTPETESIVIATPFYKPRHFYYNQKINCMPASGHVRLGELEFGFSKEDAFGTLDWGRGVWTCDNTWYWGSGNGTVDGKPFGFNIGYGFGDTREATENAILYDHKLHKLEHVTFHIPEDYLGPWTFSSSDGRFEMAFTPILDRAARTNAVVIETDQHQVFGRFSGRAVLDDGTELNIKDLLGFAEKVRNRY